MYSRTYWNDHITSVDAYEVTDLPSGYKTIKKAGTVMQQGTPQDETHYNNLEVGTEDAHVAIQTMIMAYRQQKVIVDQHMEDMNAEVLGELHEVTLTNSQTQPFNSTCDSPVSVALSQVRKNLFYTVDYEVESHDGLIGTIEVSAKALNGFKIGYTGSATSVTLALRIKGGMT